MRAMEAEARLQTRLANHKTLIQTTEGEARKGSWSWSGERVGWVELINDGFTVKLDSWTDICWRVASMGSLGSGWRS